LCPSRVGQEIATRVYAPGASERLERPGGDCTLPQILSPAGVYTCAIHVEVIGEQGIYKNTVAVWGTDWHKDPISVTASAQVLILGEPPESGLGMPAAVITGAMTVAGSAVLLAGAFLRRRTA
jgi:hypothetical protein